jgi:hypothetical protein
MNKKIEENTPRRIWQEKPENKFGQYIFLAIIILFTFFFAIFYVSQDSTKIGTCTKNADCKYFIIEDTFTTNYVCANLDITNMTKISLSKRILINKYKRSYGSPIEGHCECVNNLCTVQQEN